ncbi:MAG: hypothetical protein K2X03_18850 [Bryobacteraceae bacterium]|nr:hypothetical protein [Bryobacteraceae bacterium]
MRKQLWQTLLLTTLAAGTPLYGQCPANPLTALSGTWTFNVQTNNAAAGQPAFVVAGQFTATPGAANSPNGVLTITATSALGTLGFIGRSTTREEQDAGRYQINDNCSGGTLTMNLSSFPMQYDFVFVDGGRSLYLISTSPGRTATGSATLGVAGCAGVNPLTLLSGPYAFNLRGELNSAFSSYAAAGRFEASLGQGLAGNPLGLLAITQTSSQGGVHGVTRLESGPGRFQVNADCTGGTLTFNLGSLPQQYQFYFRAGFQELDVISTSDRTILGVVSRASAVGCPANPLSLLSGINAWTFNAQTHQKTAAFDAQFSIAGRFVAANSGALAINATSLLLNGNQVQSPGAIRLEGDAGSFQIFPDCTGGTLTMNLSSFPMQYDFWFYNNGRSLYLVSTREGRGASGSAHAGVTACPVGVDPLTLVSGLYSAKLQRVPNFTREAYGLVGLLTANAGRLGILATSNLGEDGSVARVESDRGSYQVEADCTGGTLTFNLSSRPAQYQFYFREGFRTLDAISTAGPAAYGIVSRF